MRDMKVTNEQIVEFFNQALENETGVKGNLNLSLVSFDGYQITYKSEDDVTIIEIFNTCIFMDDLQNETVTLGSKGDNYNFEFYY
jgi:hypothetical protein